MKLKSLAFATILLALSATAALAQQPTSLVFPKTIAGLFDGIKLPDNNNGNGSGGTSNSGDAGNSTQGFKGFSGQMSDYADTYNGFKIKIPAEFKLHEKGATTDWTGPLMDEGSATIYINSAPLKGVPSKTAYDINFKSKKEDRNYTDVTPVKVKIGSKTTWAFRCKEATNKPGTPDAKAPSDIHRWHLFVFGNETVYTLGFTGPYASFQSNKLQPTYEQVIKSVELIPLS
jgi:hypothetical protein